MSTLIMTEELNISEHTELRDPEKGANFERATWGWRGSDHERCHQNIQRGERRGKSGDPREPEGAHFSSHAARRVSVGVGVRRGVLEALTLVELRLGQVEEHC